MRKLTNFVLAMLLLLPVALTAQDWDREKYPDYNPNGYTPERSLLKYGRANTPQKARTMAKEVKLPDHVNNATSKYFPPVFNQDGGSCGSASRICYMFTHEINSYRDIDSSTPENNYPSHFVWLLTYGNSGKDEFVTKVGVPTSATYGGRTYSKYFGNQAERDQDFGWMTGYDKWFSGFSNRMNKPTQVPYNLGTPEGRLAAKSWLYNHGGDNSFKCGGLIGLGVASGGNWQKIPSTPNNDAIGVSNMYYVKAWGTSVDHALTMVGYDDRIEFDIDGNGIFGEESKDEKGAWIIVNSWGSGWCNGGFIYCPYAMAGPAVNSEGKLTGFWTGELYHTRKDYRPLRTIKLKMDYSRRSEIMLQAGVSTDLTATKPDGIIAMEHFRYAGDGQSGNTQPAPEVPMLGKWADGKLHTEPMEFGYDLTDLSSAYDTNQPLKYFFIVNTRSWGEGEGHIYGASIIDYKYDHEGVETPFDLGEEGVVEVKSAGAQTIISVVVNGAAFNVPQNVAISDGRLIWEAPMASGHILQGYAVYFDGVKQATYGADVQSCELGDKGIYGVAAIYEGDLESSQATVVSTVEKSATNQVINFSRGGFMIPDIFNTSYNECTIEYYIKPNSLSNYNNMFGQAWGTFLAHCNSNGKMSVGWQTGGHRIDASSQTLAKNVWTHVSIVVKGNTMRLFFGNTQVGTCTSDTYSGIGGFGDLVFFNDGTSYQDASYDEIRIWNYARTTDQIRATWNREFYGDVMPDGLIAYYKGDVITIDGAEYMRDCVGGHHAPFTSANYVQEVPTKQPTLYRPKDTNNILSINEPTEPIYAGIPTTFTTKRGDGIRTLSWGVPSLGISELAVTSPSITFPEPGSYEIQVTGSDYEADAAGDNPQARTITATLVVTVEGAPSVDADFTTTATEVASGDRVSFSVKNPVAGFSYVWSMPGADVERAGTLTAGATYQAAGDYTVTLTVTAPSGQSAQKSIGISVREVAPVADFTLSESVILKGTPTMLVSTSKHHPSSVQWTLAGTIQKIVIRNADTYEFVPEDPGVYDVTLAATNEKGTNSKKQERALIVTNAESYNGLSFGGGGKVVLSKPLFEEETTQLLSIEWWMNPDKLTDYCLGIGESTSTFMLRTDSKGCMYFHNGTRTVKSGNGFVIAGQWHHYAVSYSKGTVKFFRDAVQIISVTGAGTTITRPETFSIGTTAADMTGSIDELRIWGNSLAKSNYQNFCNQPMDDPEYYITGEKSNYKLLLYYPFNQSGGDVEDITSNGNTGVRVGFGPDGDAWGLSKGVFCLNFGTKQSDIVIDGIEELDNDSLMPDNARKGFYDISGRRVADGQALRPGLYIIDGKKRVIK